MFFQNKARQRFWCGKRRSLETGFGSSRHTCSILAPHPGSRVWFQMTLSYRPRLFSPAAARRRRCQLCCSFVIVSSGCRGDEAPASIFFCTALLIFSYISSTDNLLLLSVSSSFVFSFFAWQPFLVFYWRFDLVWFNLTVEWSLI